MPNEIVNMVASTRFCNALDINDVADTLDIDYEQEQFPGMVYRVETPKVCLLLFRSGKAVATGAKSASDVEAAFRQLHARLTDEGFLTEENPFDTDMIQISNLVITTDYGSPVDLNNLVLALPFDKTEYEPEQFPGLIYRIDDPSAVCLVFSSGKCVITGTKSPEEADEAADVLMDELRSYL
jgi:transcription initiation factor TFIID TATA-box-binding protein